MTHGRDDDALSWGGDDDPTLDVGAAEPHAVTPAAETASLPEGWSAVGRGSEAVTPEANDGADLHDGPLDARGSMESPAQGDPVREPMGNAELITLGVIGGFSALYAIGWLIGALRLQGTAQFLVAPVAYQISLWLAVLAPLVWFAAVFLLTAASKTWVRFAWLAAGVVLLVPWPFIMVGAIGR
ncbi:DNA polymerase III subunit gamma/tau [Microbacterium sp. CFH 31415]|uniref:DNA polymerase III subunit gamma/tau n=1 Tax=Microbacterium sp. CFH 31415 TaxID=2921732 RepID=UPI001F135599|nr:DNA polymerase III subunit gamma/tau [Microbacterium sp. CFH 31415]MCH6229243.1 DNA polymerase III subunit gamma/tau [Microbacterium sp. CFH 31415]